MPPIVAQPPCWMDEASLRQLRMAGTEACARGQDPHAAAAELRDMIWGRYPALPLTAIDEAASFLRPGPAGARITRTGFLAGRLARIAARFRPPP